MRLRNAAAVLAGTVCFVFTSFAQTAKIEGNVTGLDGKPVQNAQILFHRKDMKGELKTKTDKKGHYIYMGLPVGSTYDIDCVIDGKPADNLQNIRASFDDSSARPADFDLRKSQALKEATTKAINEAAETGKISDDLARQLSPEQLEAIKKQAKDREAQLTKDKELNAAYNAGMAALDAKQYDQAVPNLEKASEIDAKQVAVWANLADAYIGLGNTKTGADRDADMQKGIDAYNKAIELKPEDAALHNNYGRALAAARKYPEAQAEMAKAAQLDPPGAGKYYYNLGAILVNTGQNDEAAAAFQKAIEADPKYADAYYQYAVYLVGKAQIDSATGKVTPAPGTVEALQKYLELAPNGAYADSAKGMMETLGSTLDTNYKNPAAKETQKKKKK